ncbi:GcrA family cell cycle regulator [Parvularcula sp. LCG005]|uniref:GcrA family cell cycle regulator n=1 Tax=Parvularcula sp. LCG005 TaxID=3078805 RepID=UPI002942ADF6|nr:GcrA family cell cycle regulator [Parvularcula sp. LCG005]WOI53573.1 GcrA family cell cycle regulator [Parvularcula sp. LCG005]
MAWTDERVEQLKQLWSDGLSASQIANRMGGVTRNAVIGKVHRLGLAGRATPTAPISKAVHSPQAEQESRTPTFSLESLSLGDDRPTVSSIGANQCKWPIGDPAAEDFHFCGQSTSSAKPYCAYHSQLAFQPNAGRREAPRHRTVALPAARKVG